MKLLLTNRQQSLIFIVILTVMALLAACGGGDAATDAPADSSSAAEDSAAAEDSSSSEDTASTEDSASSETAVVGVANAPGADTAGGQLFIERCAKCHGLKGLGDGPSVGSLSTQSGLNLTSEELQAKSDDEILETISQGKGTEMPPWGLVLTLEEREELVKHIRVLGEQ